MDNKEIITKNGGVSFPIVSITTLTFVVLQLTHVIDWSWWWVFSPLLISTGVLILITIIAIIIIISKTITK